MGFNQPSLFLRGCLVTYLYLYRLNFRTHSVEKHAYKSYICCSLRAVFTRAFRLCTERQRKRSSRPRRAVLVPGTVWRLEAWPMAAEDVGARLGTALLPHGGVEAEMSAVPCVSVTSVVVRSVSTRLTVVAATMERSSQMTIAPLAAPSVWLPRPRTSL